MEDSSNSNIASNDPPFTSYHKKPKKLKPAYNNGKADIGFSNQIASYAIALRKGVKWTENVVCNLFLAFL